MPKNGIRSTYSQSPFQLLMYNDELSNYIGTGTAFFYEFESESYLITNWHNISMQNFITKEYLPNYYSPPTFIEAKLSTYISDEKVEFTTISHKINLYENDLPLWFEHPILGSDCDVVAIKLDKPAMVPDMMHHSSNKISPIKVPIKPGCGVFVIGYPKSLSVGFGLPIWKSGYIASEPFYDVHIGGKVSKIGGMVGGKNYPAFFIDTKTIEGMSGSPVFANYIGNFNTKNLYADVDPEMEGFQKDVAIGGNFKEFVGCYSGRIGNDIDGAKLGLCWRKETIDEICKSKIRGKNPHY
jgi:hypothetical protein